jgi:pimeloyl-ACP methyl ester carboxylesterase
MGARRSGSRRDARADVTEIVERLLHVGAVSLNCAVAGSGSPVLLLHGGNSRWQHLEHLVRSLADRWQVFAPDLRGHGLSDHKPGGYRLVDYADDVVSLLEQTGASLVFGHSLGGQVALVAAARRPELFRALAIGDTPLSISTLRPVLTPSRPILLAWRDMAASQRSREQIATALRTQHLEFEGRSGQAADLMPENSPWFDFMAGCLRDLDPSMLDAVIEFDQMHAGWEADRLLPKITCPVLLIQADPGHGGLLDDNDVAVARALCPNIEVARIDHAGHSLYPWRIVTVLHAFFSAPDT